MGKINDMLGAVRLFSTIRSGYRARDQAAIFLNRLLHLSYPLNRVHFLKYGRGLFEPSKLIPDFYCRNDYGVFRCLGGFSHEIMFRGDWERVVREKILALRGGVFVDVGAGIGMYTVMMSRVLQEGGRVVSIEAHPRNFLALAENIRTNNCRNVLAVNVACWSKSCNLRLYERVFGGGHLDHSLMNDRSRYVTVSARPLDDILEALPLGGADLVKLDVEGAEVHVLQGMRRTLRDRGPLIIFESLNCANLERSTAILQGFGYDVKWLQDGNYYAVPSLS